MVDGHVTQYTMHCVADYGSTLRDLLFLTERILATDNEIVLSRVIRNTIDELSKLRFDNTQMTREQEILLHRIEQLEKRLGQQKEKE